MTETIIIESNRVNAYSEEYNAILNSVSSNIPEFPKHTWKISIGEGIPVKVGDVIQVEAAMVNSVGSGDDVIEFSGVITTDSALNNPGADNSGFVEALYYVTDRNQFNLKLPLLGHTIDLQYDNKAYGGPDFSTYAKFSSCYPASGSYEGFYFEVGTGWVIIPGATPIQNPPYGNTAPSNNRYYVLKEDWSGPYSALPADDSLTVVDAYSKQINFKVPVGFNTPGSIGEIMTAQFHARDGSAENWTNLNVDGRKFYTDTGVLYSTRVPTITDQSLLSFPTAGGRLLYGRLDGTYSAKFDGETAGVGADYDQTEGRNMFYKYMLAKNYKRQIAMSYYHSLKKRTSNQAGYESNPIQSIDAGNIHTGDERAAAVPWNPPNVNVGFFGRQIVFLDNPKVIQTTNLSYYQKTSTTPLFITAPTALNVPMKVWDLPNGGLVATNIPFCEITLGVLSEMFRAGEESQVSGVNSTNLNDPAFRNTLRFTMNLGETDDSNSCGAAGEVYNLIPPRAVSRAHSGNPITEDSYPDAGQVIGRFQGSPTQGLKRLAKLDRYAGAYEVPVFARFLDGTMDNFTTTRQAEIETTLLIDPNSIWEIDYNNKWYYLTKQLDIAVIPVKAKSGLGGVASQMFIEGLSFCAFVSSATHNELTNIIPAPITGELFGPSRSLYDNPSCMIQTTQKTQSVGVPPNSYYEGTLGVAIYDYAPFCYIGADNPLINFDGNHSKFTFSGLSTDVRSGNGVFQDASLGYAPQANNQASQPVLTINEKQAAFSYVGYNGLPISPNTVSVDLSLTNYILSQSGIGIRNVGYNFALTGSSTIPYNAIEMMDGTLWDKLGFTQEQIAPTYGGQNNEFNRGNYNNYIGFNVDAFTKQQNIVSPFTTNCYVSGSINIGVVENARGYPMENLGVIENEELSTSTNVVSDIMIALKLPRKLDYSYLVLYSNIVDKPQYYGGPFGKSALPAMAYIPRSFVTGDFFFGSATTWNYTADKDYVLSEIVTDIRLPNGKPAPLASGSSVIYKITRPKVLPQLLPPKPEK
jgi:hypothetical protein